MDCGNRTTVQAHEQPVAENLAAHFSPETDIVLGYSNYIQNKEKFARHIRLDSMFQAMRYLRKTQDKRTSLYGHRTQPRLPKKPLPQPQRLYYAQLNLQRGDDDLFINAVTHAQNTKVALSPESFIRLPVPSYKRVWFEDKVNALVTGHYYRGNARIFNSIETWTCALFHLLTLTGLIYCVS